MRPFEVLDVVELRRDFDARVRKGSRGTIVAVLAGPPLAYEVEICDEQGRTVAQLTLRDDELVLARARTGERCPCCGFKTVGSRGELEVCPVCFWEDDGQDDADADEVRGGPNGSLSLTQARANFRSFAACEARFLGKVRPPRPEEK